MEESMPETGSGVRASHVAWQASAGESEWAEAASAQIAGALRADLGRPGESWLLASGGTTPAPVYRALAAQVLDWSRVVVSLVDERDVEPDADGSNTRLVRETLLRDAATAARFEPLRGAHQSLRDALAQANARWRGVRVGACVLGMGDDGHTASLFPGSVDLDAALASHEPYAVLDASGCAVAGAYPHRISLTPAGLAQARARFLLIRGATKRAVFDDALQPGDVHELPIRAAIDLPGAPLHVHWCP
jgi:6-phosphogluconolactonase